MLLNVINGISNIHELELLHILSPEKLFQNATLCRPLVKDDDIELGEEEEERMLQIKERDQCIIHEEGILHNIRPRQSMAA